MRDYPQDQLKACLLRGLQYEGGKANPAPGSVHKLSSNENPLGSSPLALEAMRQSLHRLNEYPDNDDRRLRRALSNYYHGKLSDDHFFTAPSGSELIEMIIRGFLECDQEVVISSPTFLPYRVFAEKFGAKVIDAPSVAPSFEVDIDGVLQKISKKTRVIFLASPNNPTGTIIPREALSTLISNLPQHVILVLDEVYWHFTEDKNYETALPWVLSQHNVIGLNSFSKNYGLAGLRLGYAYTTKPLAEYLRLLCKPFLLSTLQIEAGIAALRDAQFIDQTVQLVKRERAFLTQQLQTLGIKYWPSQANFIMFEVPQQIHKFEEKMLQNGVMIRAVGDRRCTNCFRVSMGNHGAMKAFLSAFEEILMGAGHVPKSLVAAVKP